MCVLFCDIWVQSIPQLEGTKAQDLQMVIRAHYEKFLNSKRNIREKILRSFSVFTRLYEGHLAFGEIPAVFRTSKQS